MSEVVLPDEWVKTELASVGEIVTGKTPSKKEPDNFGGDVPFIKPGDMDDGGYITNTAETLSLKGSEAVPTIPENALPVTCIGNLGKVSITKIRSATNQQINTVIPFNGIEYKYLYHYLQTIKQWMESEASATTVTIINKGKFSKAPVVVAPQAEQKEIAARLDNLLAQVDSIKTRLDAIPAILKRFRQSVLAAAVSGKLTETWREENSLVDRAWSYDSAKNLCLKVQSGSTPRNKPFDQGGKVPFLKVYNIVNQEIDFDYKPQYVTEEIHTKKLKRSIAYPGDVLMNIVGPPLGKVAILTNQYSEWNLNQAITLFRPNPELLKNKFLYFVLCEGALVREVVHDTKGIVGQVNISLTQCREATIPCPSLDEQTEIVCRVEQLFAFANQIEQRVKDSQIRVNNLTQSILAKAFRGELTAGWREQYPELIRAENSAQALLDKIKAQQAELTKTSRKKRTKKS